MAIEESLDLQVAAANIEEFRAQLMIAKSDLVLSSNPLLLWQIFFIKEGGPVILTY